jgi:hypothetical protein
MKTPLERLLPALLLACLALLTGCAAGSAQIVPMPSQETELADPSRCRVYVFRDEQPLGRSRVMRVHDQRVEIGTVSGGEYLCWERLPGRGIVRLQYEGPKIDRGELEALYDLQAEAGGVVYLSASLRTTSEHSAMSLGEKRGSPVLERLDERAGRERLSRSAPASVR